jgi:hypothetical protein
VSRSLVVGRLALLGILSACGTDQAAEPAVSPAATTSQAPSASGPAPLPVTEVVSAVSVEMPSIGVRSDPLEQLGLLPDGNLAAPVDYARAGWFVDGPVPGQTGPAVIAGHIDSAADGPAIFFRLRELQPGDEVAVGLSDGSTVTFRVDRVISAPKDAFPTDEVYGPTPDAQLRLITCGGSFNPVAGSYLDNTIVFATAVT